MTDEEQETLYTKLMSILMLMEGRDTTSAKIELENLIEFITFKQTK